MLQDFLEQAGYLTMPKGIKKGKYGNLTRDAVKSFQKNEHILTTGIFGVKTKNAVIKKENEKNNTMISSSFILTSSSTLNKETSSSIEKVIIEQKNRETENNSSIHNESVANVPTSSPVLELGVVAVCDDKEEGDTCSYRIQNTLKNGTCQISKETLSCSQ